MKRSVGVGSATALIYERTKELGDWRGKMLAKVRKIGHEVDEAALKDLIRAAVAAISWSRASQSPGKPAVTSFIAGAGRISSHKRRASAPASYAKHFGVDIPELAAEARSGNAGKAAKSSLRNQNPPGIPALSLRGF